MNLVTIEENENYDPIDEDYPLTVNIFKKRTVWL